jgi:hypothetical protein
MNLLHPNAQTTALQYIGENVPFEELGWGIDGVVYHIPARHAVVKVLATREKYDREIAVYRRLQAHNVTHVQQFSIPRLLNADDQIHVIEMSFVRPPFLLDFVQATLDSPQDFPDDAMSEWWAKLFDSFGEIQFPVVQSVFYHLIQRYGVYYYDLKPGNISFV